jgi:hypothetical protein
MQKQIDAFVVQRLQDRQQIRQRSAQMGRRIASKWPDSGMRSEVMPTFTAYRFPLSGG